MKRFLIFSYPNYYPSGGKNDVIDDCDTLEEVINRIKKEKDEFTTQFFDVLDMEKREWVNLF